MTALSGRDIGTPRKATASPKVYLTPKEASEICRMSVSWLAKARMNGDGLPFVKFGRAVRYEEALHQWTKTKERHSTSEDDAKKRPKFTE